MLRKDKGQITIEYLVLTAVAVVAAMYAFANFIPTARTGTEAYFNAAKSEIMGPTPNVRQ